MASLASFEGLLKKVINAERLSATKMNNLTDMAITLMEHDTELVSILYRTHKTLSPSSKIHSLYAFDALSRAARSKVNKLGLIGSINSEKGNCATFLLKIDGILDSLIRDMMSLGTTEAKEKTKKILDIWTKNNTFSSSVLARLTEIAKEFHKDTNSTSNTPPTDPRAPASAGMPSAASSSTQVQPPPNDTTQAQALLQALLSGAVSSAMPSTTVGSAGNQIGTSVALLQQLVEKAKSGNVSVPLPGSTSIVLPQIQPLQSQMSPLQTITSSLPFNTATQQSPYQTSYDSKRDDLYTSQRYSNREDYDQRSPRNNEINDRERPPHWRGTFRGRGGRGGRPSRDYDDRDGPPRRVRSRSRSPPRFGAGRGRGRDIRPYSPPHRPSLTPVSKDEAIRDTRVTPPGSLESGKDEFGRDIRPPSPTAERDPNHVSQSDMQVNTISTTEQRQSVPNSIQSNNNMSLRRGLDAFDLAAFDFSSPDAWEALGNAWQVTHGTLPSQEQLMQFVMGKMSQGNPATMDHAVAGNTYKSRWAPQQQQQQQQQPGKSIPTYESGSNLVNNSWEGGGASWQKEEHAYDYEHGMFAVNADTDAVILGGGDQVTSSETKANSPTSGTGSSTGGMKRVGDKWVWQRS
ncbi:hypothetical protein Clacol_005656 [Clathrus columnatus]|uniref:CID domain-containing protein n=1 Tax=Clathrus columnatus TaxID=1419009 RepID=A0AAV5AE73_9AGAM|nr:hypothetical protein Clacol_005656 [Clathrus columnatus]